MWQRTNEYEELSSLIDHKVEKEQELSLFAHLLKRNLGIFAFVMSFFLMMELLDKRRIRLDNGYNIVQSHILLTDSVYDVLYIPLVKRGNRWQNNHSYHSYFEPAFTPAPRKDPEPLLIYPPPNWDLLKPQNTSFIFYCYGLCGCY